MLHAVLSNASQISRPGKYPDLENSARTSTHFVLEYLLDYYMDPEYLATDRFHPSCDIYALLGVTLMQLITALPAEGLPSVVEAAMLTDKSIDLCDPR